MIAVALILGQGAICWALLQLRDERRVANTEARQSRLVLNDSMLLLHQYYVAAHPAPNTPRILPNNQEIA